MSLRVLLALAVLGFSAAPVAADTPRETATASVGSSTSLPLPRFVTLKKDEVYMRRGPGPDHAIAWIYVRRHLPLEVINEYDFWREVRDADGTEGWVSANMLSGERYVMIVAPSGTKAFRQAMHSRPDPKSNVVAVAEAGVIAELRHCPGAWCEIEAGNRIGWVPRTTLWGVLETEKL